MEVEVKGLFCSCETNVQYSNSIQLAGGIATRIPGRVMSSQVHARFSATPFHIVIPLCLKAATFSQVLETDEGSDEKAITAMGLLNTIETLLNVMEEQPEIMSQLQPTVLQVVGHIFSQSVMGKYTAGVSLLHVRSFTV
jgi:hypothetical protein